MKKIAFIFILILFCGKHQAQVRFGPKVGINMLYLRADRDKLTEFHYLTSDEDPDLDLPAEDFINEKYDIKVAHDNWSVYYGLFLRIPIVQHIGIQPELTFSKSTSLITRQYNTILNQDADIVEDHTDIGTMYEMNYINFSFQVYYSFQFVNCFLGFQTSYLPRYKVETSLYLTYRDITDYNPVTGDYNSIVFGWHEKRPDDLFKLYNNSIQLGFDFSLKILTLGGQLNYGITNTAYSADYSIKTISYVFTAGFLLGKNSTLK
jgi:hypothetical protein